MPVTQLMEYHGRLLDVILVPVMGFVKLENIDFCDFLLVYRCVSITFVL